ncbi:UDP-N-acetylglucosamine/UDP-glucose/GDP-mannose transporter isoform X7 [Phacochoerus africanus]|uniref:UDP-N-acetylglucosamine/UDP-glucose/GDP-mannose transporter isoform X7 n=1 Tax=Phacochoerus africanus TaxID=41426 RepID=UPI001FD92603|nr:UDP-N-acetylglucosamine/UDP-glucose/GDP-mannose transporter isoform X7 [Phacochoerus africanus]
MGPRWRVGFPPQPFLFRPRAGGGDGTGAGRPQVWWRLAAAGHDGRRPGGGLGRRSRLRGAAFPGGQAAVRALLWDLLLPPRAGQQGAADHLPMAVTIMILYVSKLNKIIHFPDFDKKIPVKLFPLPLLYIGNHISGLWSTSKLSLPMFTVLRKFTIPLTLLLETIILGKQYSLNIIVSVFAIILGAVIAAGSDLAFNLEGYIFVFLNDLFTAANGVYTKQKMDPKELGKYGVLFYNACFMIIPTLILSISTGDLRQTRQKEQKVGRRTLVLKLFEKQQQKSEFESHLPFRWPLNSTNGRMFYLSYSFFFPVFWGFC